MNIRKGDNVIVTAGREKGKQGKVAKILPLAGSVIVEGLNLHKKHARPRKQGEKGQILTLPSAINASNVMLVCSRCGKPTRKSSRVLGEDKARACKKCKEVI